MSTKVCRAELHLYNFKMTWKKENQHSSALCITLLTKRSKTVLLIWFVLVKWKIPVRWRALPERPYRSILLFFHNSSSFTLAQSFLRGGGAAPLPGAAGLVVVPPPAAGRHLPVRVVVVEGVPQPAAVLPLPPVVLARPRRPPGLSARHAAPA